VGPLQHARHLLHATVLGGLADPLTRHNTNLRPNIGA
jgi:hypothetical protein